MDFNEFLKDKKIFDKALKCKDIDEFKKLVDECKVKYDKPEELDKAWSYVKKNASSEDGSLDDEDLGSVAGGLSTVDVWCGLPPHYLDRDRGIHRDSQVTRITDAHNNNRDSISRNVKISEVDLSGGVHI